MRIHTPIQYLRLLRKSQQADQRYPRNLHPEENHLNLFFYNLSEMTPKACQDLLAHNTHISFICALNNDMTIGIELPFKQIEHFRESNDANEQETAFILESLLKNLIEKHYASIDEKLSEHLASVKLDIKYIKKDLVDLVFDFIVKEDKEKISNKNNALLNLLLEDRKVRKIIKSHFQNGHPGLLAHSDKSARIGGDMRYDDEIKTWIIRNKSGRFGRKEGNKKRALLLHAVHLMKMESILKSKGVPVSAQIFFKPDQMPPYMHLLYELANEALENYRNTKKVFLLPESLNKIINLRDRNLFYIGMQHIQNHIDASQRRDNPALAHPQHLPEFKLKNLPLYERYHKQYKPVRVRNPSYFSHQSYFKRSYH